MSMNITTTHDVKFVLYSSTAHVNISSSRFVGSNKKKKVCVRMSMIITTTHDVKYVLGLSTSHIHSSLETTKKCAQIHDKYKLHMVLSVFYV